MNDFHDRIRKRMDKIKQDNKPLFSVEDEILLLKAYRQEIEADPDLSMPQRLAMIRGIVDSTRALCALDHKQGLSIGAVITREACGRLASRCVEIVCRELEHLPDFEERAERIIEEIGAALSETKSTPQEIKRLSRDQ